MSYFQEAKAHFVASHQHPINQVFHHITNFLAIVAIVMLFIDWRWSVAIVLLTQVLAWSGHFFIEKNKPAAFRYPGITILASLSWSLEHWFGFRSRLEPQVTRWLAASQSSKGN